MTVSLAAVEYGAGPPLAILHGLFGSGRNWGSIAQRLAVHHRVIALDLRNHRASAWAETMDYREMAADVLSTLQARGYDRFALLGHSMGGKVAMLTALEHSAAVERLIVVDIAPVSYAPHHSSHVRAMRQLDVSGIKRRSVADAALAPEIIDAAERGFLLQNLIFEDGAARWRLNLAAIDREMPRLAGFPAVPSSAFYPGPSLFVAGSRSDYLRPEHEAAIRRLFPAAQIVRLEQAGHWVHAEQPGLFLATIERFLMA